MGRKIFISYKYSDDNVANIINTVSKESTVRTYVDCLETYFDNTNHIYKGESDNEDLSLLSEDEIWEKLPEVINESRSSWFEKQARKQISLLDDIEEIDLKLKSIEKKKSNLKIEEENLKERKEKILKLREQNKNNF